MSWFINHSITIIAYPTNASGSLKQE